VPGGVIALQIGLNFYYLPVALSAKAVGTVLLPRMAREARQERLAAFRETYDRGISWAWFVAVPAALTLVLMSHPIAGSIAFGEMRTNDGIALLSAALASIGLALLGATMYEFAKQACYARHYVIAPLVGCAAMMACVLVGSLVSAQLPKGPAVLVGLGLTITVGQIACSLISDRAARRGTHSQGVSRVRVLGRHVTTAIVTIGPAALLTRALETAIGDHIGSILAVGIGAGLGLVAYAGVQAALGAPELPERLQRGKRRVSATEVGAASP
jgi:putative peptidoglycan lipid II flippase